MDEVAYFDYKPPRAHPMVYALILVSIVVFALASLENLLRENKPQIYLLYAMPLILLGAWMLITDPSPTRITSKGIYPSRPLILRWHRRFHNFDDVDAIYPGFYDVTGAFVSPFASSDGKVTQMGLTLEMNSGHQETIRFTPSRFTIWQPASSGYKQAVKAVRKAMEERGRKWVPHGEIIPDSEKKLLLAEAAKPFLPFFTIVFLFASAAPLLFILTRPMFHLPIWFALPVSLLPPIMTSTLSYRKSSSRNAIMNRLSKSHQFAQEQNE